MSVTLTEPQMRALRALDDGGAHYASNRTQGRVVAITSARVLVRHGLAYWYAATNVPPCRVVITQAGRALLAGQSVEQEDVEPVSIGADSA